MNWFTLALSSLLGTLLPAGAATWRAVDTKCFEAVLSGWKLVVDGTRARLVSVSPPGGENILLAGGHRVWLGPQKEWPAFWPPPPDWEESPAAVTLSSDGSELTLALPRTDARFPQLLRRYRLTTDSLMLVAAWKSGEDPTSYQAVQILQTRSDTIVKLGISPAPAVPKGFGLLALGNRPGIDLAGSLPSDVATAESAGNWRFAFSGREEKIGVTAQALEARFPGGHCLRMFPAAHDGAPTSGPEPDGGLFTQAYFGATAWAMVEIEQLSPRLRAARPDGWIETSVRLEFIPAEKSP